MESGTTSSLLALNQTLLTPTPQLNSHEVSLPKSIYIFGSVTMGGNGVDLFIIKAEAPACLPHAVTACSLIQQLVATLNFSNTKKNTA
jgi:hypothetical protein